MTDQPSAELIRKLSTDLITQLLKDTGKKKPGRPITILECLRCGLIAPYRAMKAHLSTCPGRMPRKKLEGTRVISRDELGRFKL